MKRLAKVTRVVRARIGAFIGGTMSAVGVGYIYGLGWGLIVGGAAVSLYFLLLYNVDEPS